MKKSKKLEKAWKEAKKKLASYEPTEHSSKLPFNYHISNLLKANLLEVYEEGGQSSDAVNKMLFSALTDHCIDVANDEEVMAAIPVSEYGAILVSNPVYQGKDITGLKTEFISWRDIDKLIAFANQLKLAPTVIMTDAAEFGIKTEELENDEWLLAHYDEIDDYVRKRLNESKYGIVVIEHGDDKKSVLTTTNSWITLMQYAKHHRGDELKGLLEQLKERVKKWNETE